MTDNWMLKAIEDAAMKRAQDLLLGGGGLRVGGMDIPTIMALRNYFLSRNAVEAHELTPDIIRARS